MTRIAHHWHGSDATGLFVVVCLALVTGVSGCAATHPAPVASYPVKETTSSAPNHVKSPTDSGHTRSEDKGLWVWPLDKSLAGPYQAKKRGIDFTLHAQSPVFCAADGVVTYVGNSIKSYGEMVIVKHNADYLSVYANNGKILVHEGQHLQRGERMAMTTQGDNAHWHFEIRYHGKPVDPAKLLPK